MAALPAVCSSVAIWASSDARRVLALERSCSAWVSSDCSVCFVAFSDPTASSAAVARCCHPAAASLVALRALSWSCAAAVAWAMRVVRAEPAARSGSSDAPGGAAAAAAEYAAAAAAAARSYAADGDPPE